MRPHDNAHLAPPPRAFTPNPESMTMKQEIASAMTRAAPPVTVAGGNMLFDLSLDDWVKIATLCYLLLQAGLLVYNATKRKDPK